MLARFCQSRGWSAAAVTNYSNAIRLNPAEARLRIEAGQVFQAAGLEAEAGQHYAAAARLAPDLVQARFLYGLYLARSGNSEAAAAQFREAVRIMPELVEARLNLGTALMALGKNSESPDITVQAPQGNLQAVGYGSDGASFAALSLRSGECAPA